MNTPFIMQRQVEFIDTDMTGIVHFSAYSRYMETAEHEMFRSLKLPVISPYKQHYQGWPRVSCEFEFIKPLRFEDKFEIRLSVIRIGTSSVSYEAVIARNNIIIARGHSTSVYCVIDTENQILPVNIPADIADKLRTFHVND